MDSVLSYSHFTPTNVFLRVAGTIVVLFVCVCQGFPSPYFFVASYNNGNDHLEIAVHSVYYKNDVANGIDNDGIITMRLG